MPAAPQVDYTEDELIRDVTSLRVTNPTTAGSKGVTMVQS